MRVVIADDEMLAREHIKLLLEKFTDIEIIAECKNGDEAQKAICEQSPDAVFLDMQMPGKTGFEVIEAVGAEKMPPTIFVTAFDEYAIRAFDVHAVDYLLKPFSDERFRDSLERLRTILAMEAKGRFKQRMNGLLSERREQADNRPYGDAVADSDLLIRIPVKVGSKVRLVSVDDIDRIEAADYCVDIHAKGRVFSLRESMNWLEEHLNPQHFVRIHRATIVNLDYVSEFRGDGSGEWQVILTNGVILRLSRRRKSELERRLGRSF